MSSTVLMEKEVTRTEKNREEVTKNISYWVQFLKSERFMAGSLPNIVNNLSKRIDKIRRKFGHDEKKMWKLWSEI